MLSLNKLNRIYVCRTTLLWLLHRIPNQTCRMPRLQISKKKHVAFQNYFDREAGQADPAHQQELARRRVRRGRRAHRVLPHLQERLRLPVRGLL